MRTWFKIGQRLAVRTRGVAVGIDLAPVAPDGIHHPVVVKNRERGQLLALADIVRGERIAEHIGAVADSADHELVRRARLDAESCAETPAERAALTERVIRA